MIVLWLAALAALAWITTVRRAGPMDDMVSGLGHIGARMDMDLTVPIFLGMWLGMMAAMMLPTIAPMVAAHHLVVRRRGQGGVSTTVFVLGYLVVWTAIGIVPLLALTGFRSLSAEALDSRWLPTLGGVILVVAGLYQFTAWKALCLNHCRSPFSFILSHDFSGGVRSTLRAGVSHGAYCLGCCWALMAVLFVVGLMNLVWMAGIALIFFAEKNWRHGVGLTRIVGLSLIAFGTVVILQPEILVAASGAVGVDHGTM